MKRLCFVMISVMSATMVAGCMEERLEEYSAPIEISARMESEPDTRTSLSGLENGMYYALWEAEDEIAVYVDEDVDPSKFYLKSGGGTTVASFTGTRKGEDYLAVYPYDIVGSVSGDSLSVTLPAIQKYVKDSFGPGAFPMLAKGTAEDGLHFKNLCSVLKISLTGTAAIRSVTLRANDEETFVSGPATVVTDYTASTEDFLTMSAEGSRSVVLETRGLEIAEDAPADVFIVIPSQTYEGGFTIEVDTYTEKVTKTVSSDITFERSQIRAITNFELDSEVLDIIPEAIPDDEIWYITSNKDVLVGLSPDAFDQSVISNTYSDGKGVIKLSGKLQTVKSFAFLNTLDLKYLVLPKSVETLEDQSFFGLDLDSLYVSSNLKNFTGYAFASCKVGRFVGESIVQGDGKFIVVEDVLKAVSTINEDSLIIPGSIRVIGSHAIWSVNPNVTKLVIEEGVEVIEPYAFSGCKSLEEVYMPNSLQDLQNSVFDYCDNMAHWKTSVAKV